QSPGCARPQQAPVPHDSWRSDPGTGRPHPPSRRRRQGGPSLGAVGDELHLFPVGHSEAIQMSEKSPMLLRLARNAFCEITLLKSASSLIGTARWIARLSVKLFPTILILGVGDRLPLHVARCVWSAALQRDDMVNDVAGQAPATVPVAGYGF